MSQPLENQPLEKVEPKVVGGRNPPVEPKVVGDVTPKLKLLVRTPYSTKTLSSCLKSLNGN